jgi:type II secretory pathway predicted ATPase ExeA
MYLEPFQLNELPFRLSPDPQFLYLSKQHSRARAYMQSAVAFTDGFVVITGEIGSGKTTLIESFLKELPSDVVVAQVNQTQVSSIGFLQSVLVQFGFSPFRMKKAELLATINNFLIEQYSAGRKVLLIVDEAQNLSLRVLEEIRLLSGVETTKEKVLRIILAGQPELNNKLDAPELVQLTQRIRLRFHLTTLSMLEMREYIIHRLQVAGSGQRQIFSDEVFPEIFRYTGGVPRLINTLCDTSLMAAYAADRDTVTMVDVKSAVAELQWVEYVVRTHQNLAVPESEALVSVTADPSVPPVGRVLVMSEGRAVYEVPLRPGRLIIGRTPDNDLQIDSRFVSRHHCQIVTTLGASVIEDLNSTNGIYVRSRRVRRHAFSDGDAVMVGKHQLVYIDERTARGALNDTVTGVTGITLIQPPELRARETEAASNEAMEGGAPISRWLEEKLP